MKILAAVARINVALTHCESLRRTHMPCRAVALASAVASALQEALTAQGRFSFQ